MKRASWALSLSASALGAALAAGCGSSSTTNEDVVGTTGSNTTSTGAAPTYKNYAEYAKTASKAAVQTKGAPKGQPPANAAPAGESKH